MKSKTYWKSRLNNCQRALEQNNFGAYIADTPPDAKKIVIDQILPEIDIETVTWGDSLTLYETGILPYFKENPEINKLSQETREIIEKPFALLSILIEMDHPRTESIIVQ